MQIATHEGLWAHAASVALRCEALLREEGVPVGAADAAGRVEGAEAAGAAGDCDARPAAEGGAA